MEFFSFPTWNSIVTSTSDYALGFFNTMKSWIYFEIGIFIGVILLIFIIRAVNHGVHRMTTHSIPEQPTPWRNDMPGKYHNPWEKPIGRE